jgi:hypothetical protein
MKFQFDWKESLSGSVSIEAASSRNAHEIFNSMSRTDLLAKSFELRSTGIDIDFIENRISGIVTPEEWESYWNMNDEEWEFLYSICPD